MGPGTTNNRTRGGAFASAVALVLALSTVGGCKKIEARDHIRAGNTLYRDGKYVEAIAEYDQAEQLEPDGVTLLWNRACAAESQVLRIKDPAQREERRKYADMALRDFQLWYDRLPEKIPHDLEELETHRMAVLTADERCDDLLSYWLQRHKDEPSEEGIYRRIASQYEDCNDPKKKEEWFVKRTQDFPDSVKAWHELAILRYDPLFADPESGLQFNDQLSTDERIAKANEVIKLLDKVTALDPKFRDAYVWRSMAYTQIMFARRVIELPQTAEEKLEALLAREDSMMAWRNQKATCDLDEKAECPGETPDTPCCPPAPVNPTEQAADAETKKALLAEIEAAKAAALLPPEPEAEDKSKKGKGKGKKAG